MEPTIQEADVREFLEYRKFKEQARAAEAAPAPQPTPEPAPAPVAQRDPNAERFGIGVAINSRSSAEPEAEDWAAAEKIHGRGLRHARVMRAAMLSSMNGDNSREGALRVIQDLWGDRATARFLENAYTREASSQKPRDGGILVPMVSSDAMVEFLFPYTVMGQLGLTFVSSASGNLSVPKETTGVQAAWSFENQPIALQEAPKFGETHWSTKRLSTEVALPKELIRRASFDADAIFRRSMGKGMGQKMEHGFINGAGQKGEIIGLETHPDISEVNIGALIDGKNINKFKQKLRKNYVPVMPNVKWLFNEDHEYALQNVQETDEGFYFRKGLDDGKLKGHEYLISQNIATRSGTGSPSSVFMGDWAEYWVVREGQMEVQASDIAPYETATGVKSAFSRHQIVMKMVDFLDMGPRDGRAIVRCRDARTTS